MLAALQALAVDDPDFAELDRSRDVYCPFEAVAMVRQEIRHGHFLANCLDPQRPHGFGSEGLRAFLRAAVRGQAGDVDPDALTPLHAHLLECERADVRREWRRIDLLIVIREERLLVAVELKIDAGEHRGQLRRYREIVRAEWPEANGWRHLLLYVTREGDPPSEQDGQGWLPVGLGQVADEFDQLVTRRIGAESARRLLADYLSMLRRHVVTNERAEELAAKLWARHREALEFLTERRPASGSGVMGLLFERRENLVRAMAQHGRIRLELDHSTPTTIRIAVPGWDDLPAFRGAVGWTSSNRLILLEIAPDGDRNAIRVRFVLGPGPAQLRERYYQALITAVPELRRGRAVTGVWTRLGNQTLAKGLRADDVDPEQVADSVAAKLNEYAKNHLPKLDEALRLVQFGGEIESKP
jgi:hypothetical protein